MFHRIKEKFLQTFTLLGLYDIDILAQKEYEKMHDCLKKGGRINRLRAKRIENKLRLRYLLRIPCSAKIGVNFQIRHPDGIHIGATTVIGDNCRVYPYFFFFFKIKNDELLKGYRRHPKIGNDCLLGAKATVIGPIEIGDDVTIGACAIVTKNVPSHSVVIGTNQVRSKRLDEIPDKYKEEIMNM